MLHDGDRVVGVGYRDRATGNEHELHADLTVGCDGRDSTVRRASGLRSRAFGAPIDVWWFRLPRERDDPSGVAGWVRNQQLMIMLDRGDYWQCGYLIGKGSDLPLRTAGIAVFRERLTTLVPWLAERVETLASFDEVKLLDVRLERMPRWYADGLLLIGDAAHAMSPVGGVGINLAVQDAVAAARILGPALREGQLVSVRALRAVQRRRAWPAALVQSAQRLAHGRIAGPRAARPGSSPNGGPSRAPRLRSSCGCWLGFRCCGGSRPGRSPSVRVQSMRRTGLAGRAARFAGCPPATGPPRTCVTRPGELF